MNFDSVMHLGPKNHGFKYTMVTERNERIELKSSRLEMDLGVYKPLYETSEPNWKGCIEGKQVS